MISGWGWLGILALILVQAFIAAAVAMGANPNGDFWATFLGFFMFGCFLWTLVVIIARAKNRDAWSWVGLTFFFGIFAFPFLVFSSTIPPPGPPTQTCPHCQSDIPDAATVCRYCTRDVRLPTA